jgi:hypothetical protein
MPCTSRILCVSPKSLTDSIFHRPVHLGSQADFSTSTSYYNVKAKVCVPELGAGLSSMSLVGLEIMMQIISANRNGGRLTATSLSIVHVVA